MTPEERAEKLFNGMRAPEELKAKIAHVIRQATQEEREAIVEQLIEYSDGLKDVLPRDALVVSECAQMIRERK